MTEFMSGFAHLQADNTCAVTVWKSLFSLISLRPLTLTVNNFSLNCIETFAPLRYLDGNDSTVVLTNSTISFLIDPACE